MRIGAVVLARLDSRRLPEKALRDLGGRPLIQHAFDVCAAIVGIDRIILATTDRSEDDRLAQYAILQGVACHRGSVEDVACRFLGAMIEFGLDAAIRYNGDSPLNRVSLLSEAVAMFRAETPDLVSNVPGRTFPFGISVEVVGRPIMHAACLAMTEIRHREHVTQFFYDHPSFARTLTIARGDDSMRGLQLAVDTEDDLENVRRIIERLGDRRLVAPLGDIVAMARDQSAHLPRLHD